MPLENVSLTNNISQLNESWPVGTDSPAFGDDHIRLIKKVIKQTFPNVTGTVNRSHTDFNTGTIPAGAKTLFWNDVAPIGWTRVSINALSWGVRIVPDGEPGAGYGGLDDPFENAHVPSHTHGYTGTTDGASGAAFSGSGTTSTESTPHMHYVGGTSGDGGTHLHAVNIQTLDTGVVANNGNIPAGGAGGNAALSGGTLITHHHTVLGNTGTAPNHTHVIGINSNNNNVGHTHSFNVTVTGAGQHNHAITGATGDRVVGTGLDTPWRPRYGNFILCQKA